MEETLVAQLHKLPASVSEQVLEEVLKTLWRSRKSGLQAQEKSSIQSLLTLPSSQQLDPVLACLRLLIRKCVNENLTGDNLLKLFPPDVPQDLQKVILLLLEKYQRQWIEEASSEQTSWQRPSNSHVKYGVSPSPTHLLTTDLVASLWPRQHDPSTHFSPNINNRSITEVVADTSAPFTAPVLLQRDNGPHHQGLVPRLKSMTWTMKNQKSKPSDRVSIINLKLHDSTKSPSGEREVKFQLNKDTLEAMLTSMTYISDQLQNTGGPPSEPLQKRPRV